MQVTWLSLIPPLLVIIIASITRKINLGLIIGIITASLIATQGSLTQGVLLIWFRTVEHFRDIDALYLYLFLFSIGTIIALLQHTGGAIAFALLITHRIRKKITVETSTLILACVLAIDDYLSILTNGYVMRAVTDRVHIPRVKLAFLVHSMSGPLVILLPISSWVAAITVYLDQAGIHALQASGTQIIANPFFIHIQTIPFLFYSLLLITSTVCIVRSRLSYGPMYYHEDQTGNTQLRDRLPSEQLLSPRGTASDLLVPFATLIGAVFVGLPYMGGYYLFGGTNTLLESFQNNHNTFFVMCCAGLFTLAVGLVLGYIKKSVALPNIPFIVSHGISLMYSPIIMVILAAILGVMLKADLLTGTYIATSLLSNVSIHLLPVILFFVSLLCAIATGSSWGTFALMLSITIPMLPTLLQLNIPILPEQAKLLFPTLGALFSGAVCGDHISPVSETTIMTATSTGTDPIEHAYTQFPYALPVIISSAVSFLVSGYLIHHPLWINAGLSYTIGLLICLGQLYGLHFWWHKKSTKKTAR